MSEVSNKTIVALLVVALVVTVAGTVISISKLSDLGGQYTLLSGAATTGTGTTEFTVTETVSISVTDGTATFTSGFYNQSCTEGFATVRGVQQPHRCWLANSTSVVAPEFVTHVVENNGTAAINLSFTVSETAEEFICEFASGGVCTGTDELVNITLDFSDSGTDSCIGTQLAASTNNVFTATSSTTKFPDDLCTEMLAQDDRDSVKIFWTLQIPDDAGAGNPSFTTTYTAVVN